MSYYIDPSRRISLDRNSFDFGDLEEVLEWVDFFSPEDALFTIAEFQQRTGMDFLSEYKKDFGREYQAPTDDVPMVQPTPEPSPEFKREVLFYWGELQHNPKQRKFMVYTTEEDVDEWNRLYAPRTYALCQTDSFEEVPPHQCGELVPANQDLGCDEEVITTNSKSGVVAVTTALLELSAGDTTITASRAVIETLTQVTNPESSNRRSEEGEVPSSSRKRIADAYRRDLPVSPRRTRSRNRLDDVLTIRQPQPTVDLIDITEMDQAGRRKLAADKEFTCLEYHGRLYAVRAPNYAAALRRLTSFTS